MLTYCCDLIPADVVTHGLVVGQSGHREARVLLDKSILKER